jgi:hypothetical protein
MMQRRHNPTELRLMHSYIQILCRFQKSKQKVPPLSPQYEKKKFSNLLFCQAYGSTAPTQMSRLEAQKLTPAPIKPKKA